MRSERSTVRTWLAGGGGLGGGLLGELPSSRAAAPQRRLLVLQLRLLVLARHHHDAGGQVGDAHGRVGGVDALAARTGRSGRRRCAGRWVDLDLVVDLLGLGQTRTPAAEVWMRPWDSVTGTRWTRCTPPSNFSGRRRVAGLGVPLALTAIATSL
jgi:hypothetical protein